MRGDRRKSPVFQIWCSFIIFILIPTLLLNIVIAYMLQDMKNTTKGMVRTSMTHAQFLLEQNIRDSLVSVDSLGSNYQIQKMANFQGKLTSEDYGILLEVREFCRSLINSNEAYSINILCNGSNIFMSEKEVCMNLEQFYPDAYNFETIAMEELKEQGYRGRKINFYPYTQYRKGEFSEYGILYTTVMTPYADEQIGATAIVFFNEENLQNILGGFRSWDGMTYIRDAQGQVLYQIGNEQLSLKNFQLDMNQGDVCVLSKDIFGKESFAVAANVGGGIQIVSVIPEKNLYMQMGKLKLGIWLLNVTTMLMCCFLALTLAKRRGKILSNTLELMEYDSNKEENIYSALYNSVSGMVNINTSLKDALGTQKELLQSVFWNRILDTNTMSEEEIYLLAKSAGYSLDANAYCLILVGFENANEIEVEYWNQILQKRQNILDKVSQTILEWGYLGSHGIDQLVILVPLFDKNIEGYQTYIEEKTIKLRELMSQDAEILCVGSLVFNKISDMNSIYATCRNQLSLGSDYRMSGNIVWCSEDERGLAIVRDKAHIWSLPLISGGVNYYKKIGIFTNSI